jgi:hypothetical protein
VPGNAIGGPPSSEIDITGRETTAVQPGSDSLRPDDADWHPATPAQQGIWVLDRDERQRPAYLIPGVLEFTGGVDHEKLAGAVRRAIGRHPALRSRFRLNVARRRVEYRTDGPPGAVVRRDWAAEGRAPDDLAAHVEELCYTPFDLAREAPVRAEVIRSGAESTLLVLTSHHIVFDGWSRSLLTDEIARIYRAAVASAEPELSEPAHPADAVPRISAAEAAERLADAVERLRGAPTDVLLPFPRRAGAASLIGAGARTEVGEPATAAILAAAAHEGCTLFMAQAALLAATFARLGPQRDFLIAFGWPGRGDPQAADVVGMFMNTGLVRIAVGADTTWRELLRRARAGVLAAFVDGDVPIDAIAAELNPDREVMWPPMTPVLINLDEELDPFELAPGVLGRYRRLEPLYMKYDLAMFAGLRQTAAGRRLGLSLDYPEDLFDPADVAAFLTALRTSATDLAHRLEDPVLDQPAIVSDLDDPAERLRVVRSLWKEVLGDEPAHDDVSFFDAGGDSLLLVVLVEHLSEAAGRTIATVDLFRAGTVRGQAELLAPEPAEIGEGVG